MARAPAGVGGNMYILNKNTHTHTHPRKHLSLRGPHKSTSVLKLFIGEFSLMGSSAALVKMLDNPN